MSILRSLYSKRKIKHDISLHDIMFNTRNRSGISAHSCIILYLMFVSPSKVDEIIEMLDLKKCADTSKNFLKRDY